MREVDFPYRTLYSELVQRSLDGSFATEFSLAGRFVPVQVKGRAFWYYDAPKQAGDLLPKRRRYVGPADDPDIARRVETFKDLKEDYRTRTRIVSTLVREAHLTRPEGLAGPIVEALANAGFFRLRGVLVGTVAFQTYSGLLGVRMRNAIMQTGDADFALFHSIANAVDDNMPSILELLRGIDATFREIPHATDGRYSTKYSTRSGYKVEFLTPNTSSDDYAGRPASMPALGGTAAQPLRFLDFLIYQPVRAVLLHGAGVPVLVPSPERYAIHKLIVAARRRTSDEGYDKSSKDRAQAAELIGVMAAQRNHTALADAYMEAWDRGPHWRDAIRAGLDQMESAEAIRVALALGVDRLGSDPATYELPPTPA
ncbi:MAG: hypothetical protein EOP21_07395, partial [Hyphomicrobiales bacterium]